METLNRESHLPGQVAHIILRLPHINKKLLQVMFF